jgi:hypothetical protein
VAVGVVFVRKACAAWVAQAFRAGVEAVGEVLRCVVDEVVLIVVFVEAVRDLQQVIAAGRGVAVVVEFLKAAAIRPELAVFEIEQAQAFGKINLTPFPPCAKSYDKSACHLLGARQSEPPAIQSSRW